MYINAIFSHFNCILKSDTDPRNMMFNYKQETQVILYISYKCVYMYSVCVRVFVCINIYTLVLNISYICV